MGNITIGQLSVGRQIDFWLNYRPGIYYHNFDGNYPLIDPVFTANVPITPGITEIGAVFSDTDALTEVSSIDALVNGPSFYYNTGTNMLYIRLANYDPPDVHTITVGPVYAFSNAAYIDESTGTYYESRLRSSANVVRKKDALFFGKIQYQDFSVTLDNHDGFLYDVQNWDVYGQPLVLLFGDETQSAGSFTNIKAGRVKEYAFEGDNLEIIVEDTRRTLSRALPVTKVDTAVYADADRDKNKFIPLPYGSCRRVPCRVVNDGAAPANFTFVCADTTDHSNGIKAINQVYVDKVITTFSNVSLTNGTFTISSADYKTGQTVTADVDGFVDGSSDLIQNPLEILEDLINVYLGLPFNSNYYQTEIWTREKTGKPNTSFCAVKSITIDKIAESFGSAIYGGLGITPDNKFTWLSNDDAAPPLYQIKAEDWLSDIKVEFSSDEAISTARVNYDRNWNTGDYLTVIDNSNEADFQQTFKGYREVDEFDTALVSEADAISQAALLVGKYSGVQIFISGKISLNLENPTYVLPALLLQPGNNVDAEADGISIRNGKLVKTDIIGRFKGELLEFDADPEEETADVVLRYIETYDTIVVDAIPIGYGAIGYGVIGEAGVVNV